MEEIKIEKRKKAILSEDEGSILKWLYVKTLVPMGLAIIISSTVLFFGLNSLMMRASFTNYGTAPAGSISSVSKFIYAYMVIAFSNIIVMIALSAVVMYLVLHDVVLPIIRITRELKSAIDTKTGGAITIRTTDRLLQPLVKLINTLIS